MSRPVLGPGLHIIDKATYLADPCPEPSLSSSIAHLAAAETPASAWSAHPRGGRHRSDPTAAMLSGNLLDSLMLGGDTEIVCLPEYLPDANGVLVPTNGKALLASAKAWKAAQEAAGRQVVTPAALEAAKNAAQGIKENLEREGVSLGGVHQQTVIWKEGDVWCRARLDQWLFEEVIIRDLKKIHSTSPRAIQKRIWEMGYDIQAVAYMRAIEAVLPQLRGRLRFEWIFAEEDPPYLVAVVPLDGSWRATGKWRWETALDVWRRGLRTGVWPGRGRLVVPAPQYAIAEMEDALFNAGMVDVVRSIA
jgi:hypothetical protein